jgi:hypothetical protein
MKSPSHTQLLKLFSETPGLAADGADGVVPAAVAVEAPAPPPAFCRIISVRSSLAPCAPELTVLVDPTNTPLTPA